MSEHSDHTVPGGSHAVDGNHTMDVGYDPAEPSGKPLFLLTGIAAVTVAVLIALVTAFFNHVHDDAVQDQELAPASETLVSLHQREDKQLYSYQVLDKAKGLVQIPIDRAMELVIKESGEGKLPFPQKAAPVVSDADAAAAAAKTATAAPAPNAAPKK